VRPAQPSKQWSLRLPQPLRTVRALLGRDLDAVPANSSYLTNGSTGRNVGRNLTLGKKGERRILAFPTGRDPTTFLLDSRETIGYYTFWWFFICKQCRVRFRAHGLCAENKEIVDQTIDVPIVWAISSGKPGATRQFQTRPAFVPEDCPRNSSINGPLGVSDHWSPSSSPRSPAAPLSFDPWNFET